MFTIHTNTLGWVAEDGRATDEENGCNPLFIVPSCF